MTTSNIGSLGEPIVIPFRLVGSPKHRERMILLDSFVRSQTNGVAPEYFSDQSVRYYLPGVSRNEKINVRLYDFDKRLCDSRFTTSRQDWLYLVSPTCLNCHMKYIYHPPPRLKCLFEPTVWRE